MSEMKRRMLAGELYTAGDPELQADQQRCAALMQRYNATSATETDERRRLLQQLLGGIGADTVVRPPVYFDYGVQTTIGARSFLNYGAVILDVGRVDIGDDVQIGPNVQLLTPIHPMDPELRRAGWEAQKPVAVRNGVWLGGGVIVCPGVTIGEDSVVGAGSVVTRDVPPGVFAAGNPCRVIRALGDPPGIPTPGVGL
jgi:maltose O-acetyltransferase